MGRVSNKVAIVTGGAQGIGAAYAKALAREGARVVVADVKSGDAVVHEIVASGGDAMSCIVDVAKTNSVEAMVEDAKARFGGVDVLVNNAAIFASLSFAPFDSISDEDWDAVMRVNVAGLFKCSRAVVGSMRERGGGKIVNISSGTVFLGSQMLLHYVTSKAAVIGFTRALARELGPDRICVNAIAPGFTESEGVRSNASYTADVRARVQSVRAISRAQEPEDLIGALLLLASQDGDFITGQTIVVDGGHAMH